MVLNFMTTDNNAKHTSAHSIPGRVFAELQECLPLPMAANSFSVLIGRVEMPCGAV